MAGATRWAGLFAALILIGSGCSDRTTDVSAEQAKNSACVHASGAVVSASEAEEPDWAPVIEALEIDRDLLAQAGDDSTAQTVADVIEDLRSGVTQPLQISIYLRDDVWQSDVDAIAAQLAQEAEVASHEYISSEQAYDEFVELYADQPEFYEGLPSDALPASFRLRTVEGADLDELVARFEGLEGVKEVRGSDGLFRQLAPLRPLLKLCDVPVPGESP